MAVNDFFNTLILNLLKIDTNQLVVDKLLQTIVKSINNNVSTVFIDQKYFTSKESNYTIFYPHKFQIDTVFNIERLNQKSAIYLSTATNSYVEIKSFFAPEIFVRSCCIIPIVKESPFQQNFSQVILFSALEDLAINEQQLSVLFVLINNIFKSSYKQVDQLRFRKLIDSMMNFKSSKNKTINSKYEIVKKSFSDLSAKNIHDSGLKHLALWKLNFDEKENFKLIKELNCNFLEVPILKTFTIIDSSTNPDHFLYKHCEEIINRIKENVIPPNINELIILKQIKDISGHFCDKNYYTKLLGLSNLDYVLILPILPQSNLEWKRINILVMYISGIQSTLFCDNSFLSTISHKLYENFTLSNNIVRKRLIAKLFEYANSDEVNNINHHYFYNKSSDEICKINECSECFIYYINDNRDRFILKNDSVKPKKTELNIGVAQLIIQIELPETLDQPDFKKYLTNYISTININTTAHSEFYGFYDSANSHDTLRSALIVPLVQQDDLMGLLICTNKHASVNGSTENVHFSIQNADILNIAKKFINNYSRIIKSKERLQRSFAHIRHEIPGQVDFLNKNINEIAESYCPKETDSILHFKNLTTQLSLCALRISMYSKIVASLSLDKQALMKELEYLDLNVFLSSMISIFRKESEKYGVDVYFLVNILNKQDQIIRVSSLFKLAIINVVFNAIYYSRFGTSISINISRNEGFITINITNIGLNIPDHEKQRIFDEDFRGREASKIRDNGSGFGLFLTKKIIEAHDSSISCESNTISEYNIYGANILNRYINRLDPEKQYDLFNANLIESQKKPIHYFFKQYPQLKKSSLNSHTEEFNSLDYSFYIRQKESKGEHRLDSQILEFITPYLTNHWNNSIRFSTFINKFINLPISRNTFSFNIKFNQNERKENTNY